MTACAVLAATLVAGPAVRAGDDDLAKIYFGAAEAPSRQAPSAIGGYARGCLAGAVGLAKDGATFQSMRLSRNRRWGHPTLIAFLTELAADAPALGLRGLLVGDLSQPRGGPMLSDHTSHQVGLDADIWFREMPEPRLEEAERETYPFVSTLLADQSGIDPDVFVEPFASLLRRTASDERVARIFVHPHIKRTLCDWENADADRSWLSKIRPWYGHHEHFHIRLKCPLSARSCRGQRPPPAGDGCGAPLDYWFTAAPYTPDPNYKPKPPLTLARMPKACRTVLTSP